MPRGGHESSILRDLLIDRLRTQGLTANAVDEDREIHIRVEDPEGLVFRVGISPFFLNVAVRGSYKEKYEMKHLYPRDTDRAVAAAAFRNIPTGSVYQFVAFYFRGKGAVTVIDPVFFGISFSELDVMKTKPSSNNYRFMVPKCRLMASERTVKSAIWIEKSTCEAPTGLGVGTLVKRESPKA